MYVFNGAISQVLYLFIYLFVCGVWWRSGQFLGVGSLLPLCRFLGGELGLPGLASRTFTPEPSFCPDITIVRVREEIQAPVSGILGCNSGRSGELRPGEATVLQPLTSVSGPSPCRVSLGAGRCWSSWVWLGQTWQPPGCSSNWS